jgi:hypothetical protein
MSVPRGTRLARSAIHQIVSEGEISMKTFLKLVNTLTLLGILTTLVLILMKIPGRTPCLADFVDADAKKANIKELMARIPLIQIRGTVPVDVQNSQLDVDVKNYELDVHVTN